MKRCTLPLPRPGSFGSPGGIPGSAPQAPSTPAKSIANREIAPIWAQPLSCLGCAAPAGHCRPGRRLPHEIRRTLRQNPKYNPQAQGIQSLFYPCGYLERRAAAAGQRSATAAERHPPVRSARSIPAQGTVSRPSGVAKLEPVGVARRGCRDARGWLRTPGRRL